MMSSGYGAPGGIGANTSRWSVKGSLDQRGSFAAMSTPDADFDIDLSRRRLLAAAGLGGAAAAAASLVGSPSAHAAPTAAASSDPAATPPIAGLHLQFGADGASQIVVSWHTLQPVRGPRVM